MVLVLHQNVKGCGDVTPMMQNQEEKTYANKVPG